MNVVTTTWRQLVRHRLWPVALLLVAALAAVPVLLSRDAEPVPAPAPAAPSSSAKVSDTLATPVIDAATPEQRSRRRRVLGVRKDPFTPEAIKHPKKAKKKKKAKKAAAAPKQHTTPTQSSTPSTPSAPTAPVVTTPAKPKKTYEKGSLIVRFGDATADPLDKLNLKKLAALPQDTVDDATPLLVYTGLTKNRKKAIFLVDETLDATGDGTCQPHPASCETVELAKGETEFFDVVDPDTGEITAQYELDLVDIK